MKGIDGVKRSEIKVNVLGINHFTWLNRATYQGMDLIPVYEKFVDKYGEEGFEGDKKGHWMNDFFTSANRVKFDLFNQGNSFGSRGRKQCTVC